ncbi:MAG TPA: hypothetical protein ENH87_02845 [Pricia antarctica]|uniref:Uncharacterized protein n=2 Tax=root TaxID=1 RepID=A0A831QMU7_9FLAO|nr:hypothetical protein [Pricia antarctica]
MPFLFLFLTGCSKDDGSIDEVELGAVTNEVVLFRFTPDTGSNSSRLEYEIRFDNPNSIKVNGYHEVTLNVDGTVSTNLATNFSPCYEIGANSSCTISYDEQESFETNITTSVELVSVDYVLEVQN